MYTVNIQQIQSLLIKHFFKQKETKLNFSFFLKKTNFCFYTVENAIPSDFAGSCILLSSLFNVATGAGVGAGVGGGAAKMIFFFKKKQLLYNKTIDFI